MKQNSQYGEEIMEGVYIKVSSENYVLERSKIVKENFICGNEHWSKGKLEKNRLENYYDNEIIMW